MKKLFQGLIGIGMTAGLMACGAEDLAKLSAQLQAASQSATTTSTAVNQVTSTTQTVNSTVETVQTVTDLASSVEGMSSSTSSLQSASSAGDATNSSSVLSSGGVRGVARRQTTGTTTTTTEPTQPATGGTAGTPPPPPPPPDPDTQCATLSTTTPCFCVFHNPKVFADLGEKTCVEHVPPPPGTREFRQVTGTVNIVTQDDGCLSVSLVANGVPKETQLNEEQKEGCESASDGSLTCTKEFVVCPRNETCGGKSRTLYQPAPAPPPGREGVKTLPGKFRLPDRLAAPDFNDEAAVKAWMQTLLAEFEAAKADSDLKALLKSFVVAEAGWVTEVERIHCAGVGVGAKPQPGCEMMNPPPPGKGGELPPHPVKRVGVRFFSHSQPPPVCPGEELKAISFVPQGFNVEFAKEEIQGKMPGGKDLKTEIFTASLEKPTDETCTPKRLDGTALTDIEGHLVEARHVGIEAHGGYGTGTRTRCQAFEQATVSTDQAPMEPTIYVSETGGETRTLPPPQGDKPPVRYPKKEQVTTNMFMVMKPVAHRGKAGEINKDFLPPGPGGQQGPQPPPPGATQPPPTGVTQPPPPPPGGTQPPPPPPPAVVRLQGDRPRDDLRDRMQEGKEGMGGQQPGVPQGQAMKCPGEGAGEETVTITFNDDKTEPRTHRWVKAEGSCRPTPCDPSVATECKPLEISETEDGKLKGKVKKGGQEIGFEVSDPDSENKTVTIDAAGFVSGTISFHAPDENGIVGEGKLSVNVFDVQVEVTILLSESGWQHVRGKVGTEGNTKTVVFWQDRTEKGAKIAFKLITSAPGAVTVAESSTAQGDTALEAEGDMDMTTPGTEETTDCEQSGTGTMTIQSGNDKGKILKMTIYEDSNSVVTSDGSVANTPEGCAAGKTATTSTTASTTTTAATGS